MKTMIISTLAIVVSSTEIERTVKRYSLSDADYWNPWGVLYRFSKATTSDKPLDIDRVSSHA